jgi:PAS domain S-box-containing protein
MMPRYTPLEEANMVQEHEHVTILKELGAQFKLLFNESPDGIYLYIDEVHKICSERFANMFGFTVEEWERMEGFVNKHVAKEDQDMVIDSYHKHIHQKLTPARFQINAIRKDGSKFRCEVDMVPFSWRGEMIALHFVREIK